MQLPAAVVDPVRPLLPPDPAPDYAGAMARYAGLVGYDGAYVNPECQTQLLTHGARQRDAIVLLHGMTNCPRQFIQFAPLLYEQGYNVLIPRLPRNGYRDQATKDITRLSLPELKAFCQQTVDIACGLGERVAVFGLSAGGTLAAWMAAHRREIDRAIIAAPLLGLLANLGPHLGRAANRLAMVLLQRLPNVTTHFPEKLPHGYVGFQTRSIGQFLALGDEILRDARLHGPLAGSVLFLSSAIDTAVNNHITMLLADRWQRHGGNITTYVFPAIDQIYHDLIDPLQSRQRVDFVYPFLLSKITQEKDGAKEDTEVPRRSTERDGNTK